MTGFAAALLVALVAGAALTWIGVETVRDSTTGRTVASSDPSEPGFEGFLEPTPTLLVAHQTGEELRSLALLRLSRHATRGSALIIPPDTVVQTADFNGTPPI